MTGKLTQLPDADRIEGIVLVPGPGQTISHLKLQYSNARTGWCEVQMSLDNALYLLNMLEAMSQEHEFEDRRKGTSGK